MASYRLQQILATNLPFYSSFISSSGASLVSHLNKWSIHIRLSGIFWDILFSYSQYPHLSPILSRHPSKDKMATKKLVQYVAIRRDLSSSLSWPAGAVIAQACHACTAVIVSYIDDPNTCEYTKELDRMHKVVVEVPSEEALTKLSEKLSENKMDYKLWIEQPENYPTCLATKPYPRDEISKLFKKFKLYS